MTGHVRVGGAWKGVDSVSVRVGGSWKNVDEAWTRVGGVWKKWLEPSLPAYELISTQLTTSGATTYTFSNIPQDFKHLQIRATARGTSTTAREFRIQFNNSTTGYSRQIITADDIEPIASSSSSTTSAMPIFLSAPTSYGGRAPAAIIDILDYTNPSRAKTAQILGGSIFTAEARLNPLAGHGLWNNTAAITSITCLLTTQGFATDGRISLYGVRG